MRHNRDDKRFSRKSGHLRCMLANMTNDLISNERIRTTTPKAKALRGHAERMITLGKDGSLSARRRAMAFLRNKTSVTKLFTELGPRFSDRKGGYTRVLRVGVRPGDCAPMSIIELVEDVVAPAPKKKAPAKKAAAKKTPAKKASPKKAAGDEKKETKTAAKKAPTKKKEETKADKE